MLDTNSLVAYSVAVSSDGEVVARKESAPQAELAIAEAPAARMPTATSPKAARRGRDQAEDGAHDRRDRVQERFHLRERRGGLVEGGVRIPLQGAKDFGLDMPGPSWLHFIGQPAAAATTCQKLERCASLLNGLQGC